MRKTYVMLTLHKGDHNVHFMDHFVGSSLELFALVADCCMGDPLEEQQPFTLEFGEGFFSVPGYLPATLDELEEACVQWWDWAEEARKGD